MLLFLPRCHLKPIFLSLLAYAAVFSSALFAQTSYTYRTVSGKDGKVNDLKAFVFSPAASGTNRPAILLFHGGAWQLGDATWVFDRAKAFSAKGIVGISIDYRLSHDGLSPADGVEDACAAFTWVRAHASELGVDPKRVAGYGVSAGGHLVAAAAALPSVKGTKLSAASRPNAMLLFSRR